MADGTYSLSQVLEVAKIHPFYNKNVEYPPDSTAVQKALELAAGDSKEQDLNVLPLLQKENLYRIIERLNNDLSPHNTYRCSAYISMTGGGTGGLPLMFATDTKENRTQRAVFGDLLRTCGVIAPQDWVLTMHTSGYFYRALDLTSELFENAGASVLCAGSRMTPAEVVEALVHYHANVLTGDSTQIVKLAHYISTLPDNERKNIRLNKVVYTSEALTEAQEAHIIGVLGAVQIFSILGSAEGGPYALGNPSLTGNDQKPGTRDFIIDTRSVHVEILHPSAIDDLAAHGNTLPESESGIIVLTSLQRLRNPLVRYITGDIGSLHPMPATASGKIPDADLPHFRVLRLAGRDRRFSFKWFGDYFEFHNLVSLMQTPGSGILQWQVILGCLESSPQATLELRLLRAASGENLLSQDEFVELVEGFFHVFPESRHLFRINMVDNLEAFERSSTGNKVMNFVDRFH
ncbi:hypothetical protein PENANT_c062G04959 [Penicillium antarcticum]|uniref:AMP-dependent synthetase/ligase domain-containing protein n=1 Tax=Penicillium antarcticum TaxID=416450 RepID=A0A1V6PQ70_9EURO|nr:uncharacterized protein N7508_006770 [Penicillium antarcticum]KAJ5301907.1 hypothetical protein N7508_006770 [Penicillium antarcticum]OQD79103.1 hypothetical protein PENANT_c062G04959 [Penicillium antarcticum]